MDSHLQEPRCHKVSRNSLLRSVQIILKRYRKGNTYKKAGICNEMHYLVNKRVIKAFH